MSQPGLGSRVEKTCAENTCDGLYKVMVLVGIHSKLTLSSLDNHSGGQQQGGWKNIVGLFATAFLEMGVGCVQWCCYTCETAHAGKGFDPTLLTSPNNLLHIDWKHMPD